MVIEQGAYIIAGNYLHLILHGSITSSFDESKVKFARSAEVAPEASRASLQAERPLATSEVLETQAKGK